MLKIISGKSIWKYVIELWENIFRIYYEFVIIFVEVVNNICQIFVFIWTIEPILFYYEDKYNYHDHFHEDCNRC